MPQNFIIYKKASLLGGRRGPHFPTTMNAYTAQGGGGSGVVREYFDGLIDRPYCCCSCPSRERATTHPPFVRRDVERTPQQDTSSETTTR
jgi:hypothetical protein